MSEWLYDDRLRPSSPGPLHRDRRRDLNTFGGSPDTPVHQTIRGTKSHAFGLGREQAFEHLDRTWREATQTQFDQLHHFFALASACLDLPPCIMQTV